MSGRPLRTDELDYVLPERFIATRPAVPRDDARLMVVRRSVPDVEHVRVRDLPSYLTAGDALVFNTTTVLRARLVGRRAESGGRIEGLFLGETSPGTWTAMLKSNGRLRSGLEVELLDRRDEPAGLSLHLVEPAAEGWTVRVDPARSALDVLSAFGRTPLPPYILRARGAEVIDDARDRRWYQTIYADPSRAGSVAAPTAGLHFTPTLLERLAGRGLEHIDLTLHVGAGTFKPIETDTVEAHPMHAEWFEVDRPALDALRARERGASAGRLVAVGTTVVRTLESLPVPLPDDKRLAGETRLLIAPPYGFRRVDALLTNFHLPRSTLLALVAAMLGLDRLRVVYELAIKREYRFYSYGDAMLILP